MADAIDNLPDQRLERIGSLQCPQADSVRRTDVDDEVAGKRMENVDRSQIVVDRFLVWRVLVLPDVDPDDAAGRALAGQVLPDGFGSGAVESKAIDDRAVFRQPEQTRLRIARLRARSHGADFRESEPKRSPCGKSSSLFIETGGEADRTPKR